MEEITQKPFQVALAGLKAHSGPTTGHMCVTLLLLLLLLFSP